jgi:drug/metabolite transporter (DMT)-like permease
VPALRVHVSPYLLLAAAALFWAGNWVVGRGIREDVPPIALSFWRWVIALALILPLARAHLREQFEIARRGWKGLLVLGVIGTAAYNALAYIGLSLTTATNGLLLNSFAPVLIVAMAWVGFGTRLGATEALGIVVSLGGVLVIVAAGDPRKLAALTPNAGDLWVLGSVCCWSLYTCLLRLRPAGLHPLAFLFWIGLAGLVATLPFYLWEIAQDRLIRPTPQAWAAITYTGIFPAFLGYIFWNRGVSEVGAHRAGLFMHLMPAFGILLAAAFLGERMQPFHLAGIALIFSGIFLATRRSRT